MSERIDRLGAICCPRWECCPTWWNSTQPDDPITYAEWEMEQTKMDEAVARREGSPWPDDLDL